MCHMEGEVHFFKMSDRSLSVFVIVRKVTSITTSIVLFI